MMNEKQMNDSLKHSRIEQTSAGLRDALFSAMEKLRDGQMDAEDAKALATLSKEICQTVRLEIEVAKLRTEYPADTKLVVPAPLQLGPAKQAVEKK